MCPEVTACHKERVEFKLQRKISIPPPPPFLTNYAINLNFPAILNLIYSKLFAAY